MSTKQAKKVANSNIKAPAKMSGVVGMDVIQGEAVPTVAQSEPMVAHSQDIETQDVETALEPPVSIQDNSAIEALKAKLANAEKAIAERELTIRTQQGLLLDEARAQNAASPYQYALSAEEMPLVEEHNALVKKHVDIGLTQNELHRLFTVRMQIDGTRGKTHAVNKKSLLSGDQPVAKEFGQKRKLHIDDLPPGWHHYQANDSRELDGKEINEALTKGYRFVKQDGSYLLESFGEVWNPDAVGDLVTQHVGIDKTGGPITSYLMVEPIECYNERNRMTQARRAINRQAAIEENVNNFSSKAKSGETSDVYGNVNISSQV